MPCVTHHHACECREREAEAFRNFALLTLEEAENAVSWYKARQGGGQQVGVCRMPLSVAQAIVRDAKALGLRLEYPETEPPIVAFDHSRTPR